MATKKKTNEKPEAKANGKDKQYQFSRTEAAMYAVISAKMELANEKEKSAAEIRQVVQMLQENWVAGILSARSIKQGQPVNIDVAKGLITVPGEA